MTVDQDTCTEAFRLVQHYAIRISNAIPTGSMSTTNYDTAWASMIVKTSAGERKWLFPQSFEALLDEQCPDGGWWSESSIVDGILNTMAALTAMLNHLTQHRLINEPSRKEILHDKISNAVSWLDTALQTWDVQSTDMVGFEMLVPAHLQLLSRHGVTFTFPGLKILMQLHEKKLEKFNPALIYQGKHTTYAHSLEAFIGKIDFDKAKFLLTNGGMMGSPSATSAYLIHSSTWDDEAETYLRTVFEHGQGASSGTFPSAFPSEVFEVAWILSTLLHGGFTAEEIDW